jgi:hypothetical protein
VSTPKFIKTFYGLGQKSLLCHTCTANVNLKKVNFLHRENIETLLEFRSKINKQHKIDNDRLLNPDVYLREMRGEEYNDIYLGNVNNYKIERDK